MTDWFDELHDKRKRLVSTLEENNTDLRMLLEDKYADPVHFVYELLQNAEDQKAERVEFLLMPDRLLFKHFGNTFKQRDVDSITNVGNSSKQGQANKIGCFGIGFKSVFDVTSRPQIYSTLDDKPFAFAIEEKFVPVRLSCPKDFLEPNETRFVFPFKQGQEEDIFSKVWKKLRELGPATLLFLDHIESIKWRTTTHEGEYLCERADPVSGKVQLLWEAGPRNASKEMQYMQFLRYSKIAPVKRGDSDLKVSIAFRLESDQIMPEPGLSVLNVFFPTSEKTGLKFQVHAPMLLTDSRANIRPNDPTNRQLVQTCAELLAESLPRLRDANLLTATCLNSLPIREEDFPEQTIFRPLYDAVLKVLATEKLLPTAPESSCKYVDATHARITDSKPLRALLSEKQLTDMEGFIAPICWLPDSIGNDTTRDLWVYLSKQLHVEMLDGDKLARKTSELFLQKQADDWLTAFYRFLSVSPSLWESNRPSSLRNKPIIRLQDNRHVMPFDNAGRANAFLPTGSNSALDTVKMSVCEDEKARKFLVDLGITLPDTTDEVIRLILPAYRQSPPPYSASEYNLQLATIAIAIENCKPNESEELRDHLLQTPFLRVCNAVDPNTCKCVTPTELYLRSTELMKWFEGNTKAWFASATVTKHPGWPCILKFLNTRRRHTFETEEEIVVTDKVLFRTDSNGQQNFVYVYSSHGWHKRGIGGFDPNANIEGLEFALSNMTLERAHILWQLLLRGVYLVQGIVQEATKKDYSNGEYLLEHSVAGQLCCKYSWLPNKLGEYFKPKDIPLLELPNDFDHVSEAATQLAEKLGMKQIVKTQEQLQAEELHLPVDIVEYIKNNPELIAEFVRSKQSPSASAQFPSGDDKATFSDNRASKIQEEARNNPDVRRETRERTVRLYSPNYKAEAKNYLQNKYKDDWGAMFCQICEKPMPFALPNGESYFEMVQYVKGLPKESLRHYLALCPICAAKYLYANGSDAEALQHAAVHANLQTDYLAIPVELAGDLCTIRFNRKHLGDLKNTLIGMLQPASDIEEE